MIKVIEMRKYIQSALLTVSAQVYYQSAPDGATMPYLVYELPNSNDNGLMERFVLEVDGWDDSSDTTAIETLMDNVDQVLHRQVTVINEALALIFYRENKLSIVDDDEAISRRKYTYQVRTY